MSALRTLRFTALSRRLWVGRLALLLALFGALAPTVSHALNWARGQAPSLIEVCTSQGPRWMALGQPSERQSEPPNPSDAATVFEHCPFCLLAADRLAPPPAAPVHLFLTGATYEQVAPAPLFFAVTHTHPSPPPRGPPLSS
jgi:hypothetical protein